MRVAALYDIHGNLPALDAVLAEIAREPVDLVVVGGDVLPGPMPRAALDRLQSLGVRARFIRGNGDRETLAEVEGRQSAMPDSMRQLLRWSRDAARRAPQLEAVGAWPPDVRLSMPGLGSVLFCHATPRNDEEIVTQLMPDDAAAADLRRRRPTWWCAATRTCSSIATVGADARRQRRQRRHAVRAAPPAPTGCCSDRGVELRRTAYDLRRGGRGGSAHRVPGRRGVRAASTCWSRPTCSRHSRGTGSRNSKAAGHGA